MECSQEIWTLKKRIAVCFSNHHLFLSIEHVSVKCYSSHAWISFFQVNISSRYGTMSLSTNLSRSSNITFFWLRMLARTDSYFLGKLEDSEFQFKFGSKKRSNFTCELSISAIDLDMVNISKRSELIFFMSSKDKVDVAFIVHHDMFLGHRNMLATVSGHL
jgi:hypothetical protein